MTDLLSGTVFGTDSAICLLVLLVTGHVFGDFVFQTRRMVAGKDRPSVLLQHGAVVTVVHLAAVTPYLSGPLLLTVVAVGGLHTVIDGVKSRFGGQSGRELVLFTADQAFHLAVILGGWIGLLLTAGVPDTPFASDVQRSLVMKTAIVASGFAFVANGGSGIVEGVLEPLRKQLDPGENATGLEGSGRKIGMLERVLALVLILLDQWAAMVLLVAVKSIARFEELKVRRFAEYYLVGTLSSLIVAVATGLLMRTLVF